MFLAVLATGILVGVDAHTHDLITTSPERPIAVASSAPVEREKAQPIAAEDQRPSALLLDLRTGFGLPLGEARSFANSRGAADIALGYLAGSGRYAGVTAGFSKLDSRVASLAESTFQFGVDLAYRPTVPGKVEPWIALGFAWQIMWLTQGDFYMKAVGPQFPIVRLGANIRLSDRLAVGPFGAFAYRRYDPFSLEGQTPVELRGISRRDGWLLIGVSASFNLFGR
jgi:hypothetical protein